MTVFDLKTQKVRGKYPHGVSKIRHASIAILRIKEQILSENTQQNYPSTKKGFFVYLIGK